MCVRELAADAHAEALVRFWLRFTPEFQILVAVISSPVALGGESRLAASDAFGGFDASFDVAVALWGMLSRKNWKAFGPIVPTEHSRNMAHVDSSATGSRTSWWNSMRRL